MMEFVPLALDGTFLMRPKIIGDIRGRFVKPISVSLLKSNGLRTDFIEQYYSYSNPGVIRGMHFQSPPYEHAKVVYVVKGVVKDVLLDLRRGPDYGKFFSLTLDAATGEALYIPPGIAHGFATELTPALMVYNVTSEYKRDYDHGVRWDSFGFNWGNSMPVISERDRGFPRFEDFITQF